VTGFLDLSTSMTLNPKNIDFKRFFGDFWLQKNELRRNGWR